MPTATVSTIPEEHALKSLPGAYVKLRRMTYGERLHRQDIAMSMQMQQDQRTRQGTMQVRQSQTAVGQFELATCVVEHNLEKEDGAPLNFRNQTDFLLLDGRVGEEIANLIEEMHDWEASVPNSSEPSDRSSSAMADQTPPGTQTPVPWRAT
jgi:hypothetical protein